LKSMMKLVTLISLAVVALAPTFLRAQAPPDPAKIIEAQRESMKALAFMDGVWRGEAWVYLPSGQRQSLIQTERIGPFLGGSVKVIEGRGHDADGSVLFNALGVISFDVATGAYSMRSYADGRWGDFDLELKEDGYVWRIPAGPATIRYTAVVQEGRWREIGERIVGDGEPVQFFEMNLERLGDTDWPSAGAVSPE